MNELKPKIAEYGAFVLGLPFFSHLLIFPSLRFFYFFVAGGSGEVIRNLGRKQLQNGNVTSVLMFSFNALFSLLQRRHSEREPDGSRGVTTGLTPCFLSCARFWFCTVNDVFLP
jgi:hypothetical protein